MDGAVSLAIALVGALLGGGAALLNTSRQKAADAAVTRWKSELEHRQKQLNELYGPLTMLRSTSRSLRRLLPSRVNGSEWRLVHHIGDVRREWDRLNTDPSADIDPALCLTREQLEVAHLIVDYGNKTCDLLNRHAGLLEGPPVGGLVRYQEHHNRLRASWETASNQPREEGLTFPGEQIGQQDPDGVQLSGASPETDVDAAIEIGITSVRRAHDKLLKSGPVSTQPVLAGVLLVSGVIAGLGVGGALLLDARHDATRLLVTTPQGVLCGSAAVDENSQLHVGSRPIPPGSEVEFVDACE